MAKNPDGHSPNYWNKHPEAKKETLKKPDGHEGSTSRLREQSGNPENKHHGLDFLLAATAIVAEVAAVIFGHAALGWVAAALLWFSFLEYTKARLKRQHPLIAWGVRAVVALVMVSAVLETIHVMEGHLRARFFAIPKVQFSMDYNKKITIDNSKGNRLSDFKVNALDYFLDPKGFPSQEVKILKRESIGGDINFEHFDVAAREVKTIDPRTNIRYAFIIQEAKTPFDDMFHFICLRILFTNEDTGERFVHYIVFAPYVGGIDSAEHPEDTAGESTPGTKGYSFHITQNIKEDARIYYGNEYREYHPY